MIELHLLFKHKMTFDPKERPWKVNFYGTISALETERQRTRESEMTAGATMAGAIGQLRDLGLSKKSNKHILSKVMGLDEDAADMISIDLAKAQEEQQKRERELVGREPRKNPEEELEEA
jgi:hypothetical protein